MAIIEYLDETHPEPPLLPRDAAGRARVRALAAIVACDIHPLNNLRVLRYLHGPLGHDEGAIETWYNHWIDSGFRALERLLADDPRTGAFCHGDKPGLADIALVPQVVNAERYRLDLAPYPTIVQDLSDLHDARRLCRGPSGRGSPIASHDPRLHIAAATCRGRASRRSPPPRSRPRRQRLHRSRPRTRRPVPAISG